MTLLILGGMFLAGLVADVAGRLTSLPRVTLMLLAGLMLGSSGFNLIPADFVDEWFPMLTTLALSVIGFLMGQKLSANKLRSRGRVISLLALGKVVGVAVVVALAVWILTQNLVLALLLGGIATATDPAAIFDVVHETTAHGEFTENLLGIVAVDDALGLIVFSLLIAFADSLLGNGTTDAALVNGVVEALASIAVGALLGVPMAYLTGRLEFGERGGEPIQAEAIAFVLLCAGTTTLLELSPILASMTMGSVVASLATHHKRPFDAIEGIEWPFLILFFIFAGASLVVTNLAPLWLVVLVYICARAVGTYAGTWLSAAAIKTDDMTRRWMGIALLPQAGVALGMA
ncbi:MAG: NhaP-type Na+/H+ or K+/H+ antiporter, partial [Limisphaerales bacterium]